MTSEMPHILVVDDDTRLRVLLQKYLSDNGFRVTSASDSAEARARLTSFAFDLIVLDVMMPGEDGLELTRALRIDKDVPILLLTARGETEDRIAGLESGADDYLTKPFEPRELVLRINGILRRTARPRDEHPEEIRFGAFRFNLTREELHRDDTMVRLTAAEAALLKALARRPGQPVSRDSLAADSQAVGGGRAIDVQVTRLRRKIEENPRFPRYLRAVRGIGYILVPD